MRLRRATLAIAALTMLGVGACGDHSDDDATPTAPAPPPSGAASVAASGAGTLGAPGASTAASTAPTEGTSATKPPKKGAGANQGPAGKPAGSPDVLTAAGLGPYSIGVAQTELKSARLVGTVTAKESCATAKGLSEYHTPALAFTRGKLQRLTVTSSKVATTTGAKVGTSFADVQAMYPSGKRLDDWLGASAWYTLDGGNALLFRIAGGKVASIDAGVGQAVQFYYTDKQGC